MKLARPARAAGLALAAAFAFWRAAWREAPGDLRDSLGPHDASLGRGHLSLETKTGSACSSCHIQRRPRAQRALWASAAPVSASQAPAHPTALCLSCHDGLVAGALAFRSDPSGSPSAGNGLGESHPVGSDYETALRSAPHAYNDPAGSPGIVLEDGKVGCSSCHATHGGAPGASNLRKEVCLACHRR